MEFKDINELATMMTVEQAQEAKSDFEKFYKKPFGNSEEIFCSSEEDSNLYLKQVDLADFE